jgi:hypothetical protein
VLIAIEAAHRAWQIPEASDFDLLAINESYQIILGARK